MHFVPQLFQVKRLTSKFREVTEKLLIAFIFHYLKYICGTVHITNLKYCFYIYVDQLILTAQLNGYDLNKVCAANATAVFL